MERQSRLALSAVTVLALMVASIGSLCQRMEVFAFSPGSPTKPEAADIGPGRPASTQAASLPVVVDSAQDFDIVKLADGVYAAIAKPTGLPSGNAGFVIGSEGVPVVDTTLAPVTAQELITEIKKITPLPIKYAMNTHYHVDHSGGNQVFAEMKVPIIAQENTRDWVPARNKKFFPPGDGLQKARDDAAKRLSELGAGDAQKRAQLERRLRTLEMK